MITSASISAIHHTSLFTRAPRRRRLPAGGAGRRADGAGDEAAVDPGAELHGGAVRADADDVAALDAPHGRDLGGQLDDGVGPLVGELRDALDRRPGEQRPVAGEAERAAACDPRL